VSAQTLLVVALLCPAAKLHAHTGPGVMAIVDEDESGVRMLRLNQGLAQKVGDQWRFVCPSAYQGEGQDPAAALPGGGTAVASPTGVWLMRRDGTLVPHPDPATQGQVTAFARSPTALYALRARQDLNDVIQLDADSVHVLWTDTRFWSDIAVGTSFLQLVRFDQGVIEELQLSLQGEVISQQRAALADVVAVNARTIGDVPYFTARLGTMLGTTVELGRIEQGAWQILQMAESTLAGPVETADGTRFIGLEGKLAAFDAEIVTPREEPDFITGLERLVDHSYACTVSGLRDLSSAGLGATRFDLSLLEPPDSCVVPEAQRSACNLEWQHFRFELLAVNIPVTSAASSTDCSANQGAAGAAGAATTSSAGTAAPSVQPVQPTAQSSAPSPQPATRGGCSILALAVPSMRAEWPRVAILAFSIASLAARRRTRRNARRRTRGDASLP
jgi:hypothetical protein